MVEQSVETTMEAIRQRIEAQQGSHGHSGAQNMEHALSEMRRHSRVNAHWGISASWPVGGRFEVLAKRAMRIGLRWLINPIVEQQNDFNAATLAALYELEAELAALRNVVSAAQDHLASRD